MLCVSYRGEQLQERSLLSIFLSISIIDIFGVVICLLLHAIFFIAYTISGFLCVIIVVFDSEGCNKTIGHCIGYFWISKKSWPDPESTSVGDQRHEDYEGESIIISL